MSTEAILVYFLVINVVAFFAIRYDKSLAINNLWRIPEKTLHLLTFMGGFFGSSLAMQIYRHKIKKFSYIIVHFFILIFWIVSSLAYYIKSMPA